MTNSLSYDLRIEQYCSLFNSLSCCTTPLSISLLYPLRNSFVRRRISLSINIANYFEKCVEVGIKPIIAANYINGIITSYINEKDPYVYIPVSCLYKAENYHMRIQFDYLK